jgi:hypothetical protein
MGSAPRLYNEKFQGSSQLSEAERVRLKKSLFQLIVVENLVEFWRWQSKVIEKKWIRLCKDDFICYLKLQWDRYEILCQDATSEDCET